MIKKLYLQTKKLHYGKYLYKAKLNLELSYIFRNEHQKGKSLRFARLKLNQYNSHILAGEPPVRRTFNWQRPIPLDEVSNAEIVYNILIKHTDYIVRCETNTLFIYTNSKHLINKLEKNLNCVLEIYAPSEEDLNLLLNKSNIIIVDKPPAYEYKVTFGKKLGSPALARWIQNNPNLAKIGPSTLAECLSQGYVKGYYFYVRDEKTLFMTEMIIGDNIQRVDKLVYNNNIDK